MIPRLIASAAFAALTLVAAREADACSCMAADRLARISFKSRPSSQARFAASRRAERARTGPQNVRVEFEDTVCIPGGRGGLQAVLTSAAGVGSCAYPFKEGERYVVYASQQEAWCASSGCTICSRTRPIAEAAEDLLFFKSLSRHDRQPARVSIDHA